MPESIHCSQFLLEYHQHSSGSQCVLFASSLILGFSRFFFRCHISEPYVKSGRMLWMFTFLIEESGALLFTSLSLLWSHHCRVHPRLCQRGTSHPRSLHPLPQRADNDSAFCSLRKEQRKGGREGRRKGEREVIRHGDRWTRKRWQKPVFLSHPPTSIFSCSIYVCLVMSLYI